MPKPATRSYSRYSLQALTLLGNLIREGRISANMTAEALAQRVGISRSLLQRIEKGDPGCAIGVVFEVMAILGLPLFEADAKNLAVHLGYTQRLRALLPKSVRSRSQQIHDDF